METEQTEHRGFVLEGVREDNIATGSVVAYWEAFRRLASVGLPAKTHF